MRTRRAAAMLHDTDGRDWQVTRHRKAEIDKPDQDWYTVSVNDEVILIFDRTVKSWLIQALASIG